MCRFALVNLMMHESGDTTSILYRECSISTMIAIPKEIQLVVKIQ